MLLVCDRLREGDSTLTEDEVYERVEFVANPSLGFPGSDVDGVEFFVEHGQQRARLRFNLMGLVGAGSPLPAVNKRWVTANRAILRASFLTCFTTVYSA